MVGSSREYGVEQSVIVMVVKIKWHNYVSWNCGSLMDLFLMLAETLMM